MRRPHGEPQPHRLGHVDRRVVKTAVVGQARAEELRREVRLEIRRAEAHVGVSCRVTLVETVAGERHHLVPEGVRLGQAEPGTFRRRAAAALHELLPDGRHLVRAEVAHAAAQLVGLGPGEAGNLARQPEDLLLEDQHAFRRAQDRFERRVQIGDRLLAAIAPDERGGHTAHRGPGLEEGVGDGQVGHGAGLELAQRALRAVRLALEHADRLGALDQRGCRRIIQRDAGQAKGRIVAPARQLGRICQHRQRTDAQQIHLRQPQRLHVAVLELGDQEAFGRPLHRQHVGERARGDHDAAGMDAQMIGLADKPVGRSHDLALGRIIERCQHIVHGSFIAAARVGVPVVREQAHQVIDTGIRQPHHLARLAHGRLRSQRADCPDQRDTIRAVGVAHVAQHLIPPPAAEVQVDIRRVGACRIEEALEEQPVFDRVHRGDAGAVGHQGVRYAPARADRDIVLAGEADDVGDDEKEGGVAVRVDRGEFVLEAISRTDEGRRTNDG